MKSTQSEIDWLRISNLIIRKLKRQFPYVPDDEIEASSFVGLAVANSMFDPSKSKDIEPWLYHIGSKRTIDDLRSRKLIDRVNTVNKRKERLEIDIGGEDWSIFKLKTSKNGVCEIDRKDFWKEVMKCLSKEEKKAILLYYRQSIQMKEVASLLHFTEGRVSQIIKEALLKIKKRFEEQEFIWNEFFS
jgi:RNA polymerase sigma factor (sigma-70 family)